MTDLYTVVQHSAYVGRRDPQFAAGLESKHITAKQAEKIRKAGGRVFASYNEAEDFAEAEQYPEGYNGLVPAAPGSFTTKFDIDGFPVYIEPPTARHDADGKAYWAYYRNELTLGFIWNGRDADPIQVTREMGEPVIDTFHLIGGGAPATLDDFQRACDAWAENHS